MARSTGCWITVALVAFTLAPDWTGSAGATDFHVTTGSDGGVGPCAENHCTLRDAVVAANADSIKDIIYLTARTYTLSTTGRDEDLAHQGDLDILEDVEVRREGTGTVIIDGNGLDRVFDVHGTGTLAQFFNLTVQGGDVGEFSQHGGGGVRARDGGAAYFWTCRLKDNTAIGPETPEGGAALATDGGTVLLADTVVTGNSAHYASAIKVEHGSWLFMTGSAVHSNYVVYSGAIVSTDSTASLVNSTVVHNTSNTLPAGIVNQLGEMTVDSCTVGYNDNVQIRAYSSGGGLVRLRNTAILGDCAGSDPAGLVSEGGNLGAPGTACRLFSRYDRTGLSVGEAKFGPLGNHGGPTPVCPPSQLSPAVDFTGAEGSCQSEDQRGVTRPKDGDGDTAAVCDIGAVERRFIDPFFGDGFESGDTIAW